MSTKTVVQDLDVVNRALMFTAKTIGDEFKKTIDTQLNKLFTTKGAIDNRIINEFANIGSAHLVGAKNHQPGLDKRVMDIIGKSDKNLINGLVNLKATAQSITPDKISLFKPSGIASKLLRVVGYDYNESFLAKAATKYETAEQAIGTICKALDGAKDVIKEDLETMLTVGDDIASSQFTVARDIYLLDKLLEKLDSPEAENITDISEEARQNLTVALRQDLLDLKALEAVNAQFLITLEQTCNGARLRIKSVERACGLTLKVASIGLLIRGVLENNSRIQKACDASSEFTSQQLVANAELFNQQTIELKKSTARTFLSIESLQKAHNIIMDTINDSTYGIESANEELKAALVQIEKLRLPTKSVGIGNGKVLKTIGTITDTIDRIEGILKKDKPNSNNTYYIK